MPSFNAFKVYKSVKPNSKYKHFLHQTAKYWIKDEDEEVMEEDQQPGTSVSHRRNYDPPQRISKDPKKHKLAKIVTGGLKAKPKNNAGFARRIKKSDLFYVSILSSAPSQRGLFLQIPHTSKILALNDSFLFKIIPCSLSIFHIFLYFICIFLENKIVLFKITINVLHLIFNF